MPWKRTALFTVAALLSASAIAGKAPTRPYTTEVWSSVLFDTHGRVEQFRIVDEDTLPKAFAQQVSARLDKATIEPRMLDGHAASFRTGVRMSFEVTPGANGGTVRVADMRVAPLPLKSALASYPDDLARSAGRDGTVAATCHIALDGKCDTVDVQALPGIPESARRWAEATFKLWSFEPQQLDGKPQRGEYALLVRLETDGPVREDFRQNKFERLMMRK